MRHRAGSPAAASRSIGTVVLAILSALILAIAYLRELFLLGLLALGVILVGDSLGEVQRRFLR